MSHYHSFNGESVRGADSPCSQCRAATCPDCGSSKAGVWTCWDCSTGRTKAEEDQDDKDEAEIARYVAARRALASGEQNRREEREGRGDHMRDQQR